MHPPPLQVRKMAVEKEMMLLLLKVTVSPSVPSADALGKFAQGSGAYNAVLPEKCEPLENLCLCVKVDDPCAVSRCL